MRLVWCRQAQRYLHLTVTVPAAAAAAVPATTAGGAAAAAAAAVAAVAATTAAAGPAGATEQILSDRESTHAA